MDIEKIKNAKTKYLGKIIEYYEEINSTHIKAKEIANEKNQNGKIIIADMQTNGIGTKGRNWYTGKGNNIAMSMILHINCKLNKLEGLTVEIAKTMQTVIKKLYNINLEIKEPNDLILNNKKISGILTEINCIGEKINYLIISIGFNVNECNFSEETINIATSLKKEYNKNFIREEIIINFIEELEKKLINLY